MKFYIVNDFDRPDARHVAQIVNTSNELDYIHPDLYDWCKDAGYLLSTRDNSTTLEDFGFDIVIKDNIAHFKRVRDSIAKYANGEPRRWQGGDVFTIATRPMV